MRKHNGMRPQDIVILLKIISFGGNNWQGKDLASSLFLSGSEISESLHRSHLAGLIDFHKQRVARQKLFDFLRFGLAVVFPQQPGRIVNGIATAHSHPFMKSYFISEVAYVWPDLRGKDRGQEIEPLYPKQVEAAKLDDNLYLMLSLLDVLRVGRVREINIAVEKLSEIIFK
jgi:hypothetical protein